METPSTFGKNLVINSHLSAGGNIHIGDIIYNVHEDFAHSILFLTITRSGDGHIANLALKTRHQRLQGQAVGMLQQAIELQIPDSLFRQVDQFQASRRKLEGNRYHKAYGTAPVVLEATLSQLLYDHFFAGDIGEVVRNFLQALEARKITELLLVIASPEEDIRNLPWEMVLDRLVPQKDGVLPLQGFGLVRTMEQNLDGFNMSVKAAVAGPLKMLFVTALPEDLPEKNKNLELEDEQKKLIDAVGALEATGDNHPKMVIEFLDVASLVEIKKALQARHHDVVHISGHGQFVADLEQGFLYLETDEGDTAKTEGAELAAVLRGLGHVKLLVLSACETAMAGKGGTAEALATSGIPAVLAMRFSVLDAGAKAFTMAFYTALADGRSITESMVAGRLALSCQNQNQNQNQNSQNLQNSQNESNSANSGNSANSDSDIVSEWFTPVLYLNQYVAELVDVSRYQFPQDFYTHGQFLKEAHTRLIGSGFIGRKKQRILMRRAFRDRKAVCLVGLGGMGKTTLAEAFARNYGNQNHRIIIWRGENEITELGILNRIVEEFRIWQPGSPLLGRLKGIVENAEMLVLKRLEYLLRNCLGGEKVILIFDNFEDLLWQEGDASQRMIVDEGMREMLNYLLLNAPEQCRVMFTSRYRIEGLAGEVLFLDLDKLGLAEQYRLMNFSEVLRVIPAGERERIYARLDGLPRAFTFLEGLVRNVTGFSFGDLEAQLGQVEAEVFADLMLGRIYGLLSEELQRVFLVASVFFTRTPVEALVAVIGDDGVLEKLKMLREWGLCILDFGKGDPMAIGFEVHALTRGWVFSEELMNEEEWKGVALGVGEYLLNTKAFWNVRLAMEYFRLGESWDLFTSAAMNLYQNCERVGLYDEALEICGQILNYTESEENKCAVYSNIGKAYLNLSRFDEAYDFFQRGLEIAGRTSQQSTEIAIRNGLGKIFEFRNNHNLALEQLNVSLSISRKLGSREEEQITLNNIGSIYLEMKDAENSKPILEQSLIIAEELQDALAIAGSLAHLGYWEKQFGDSTLAIQLYQRSLEMYHENEHRQGESSILNNLGRLYMEGGELEMAIRYFQDALEIIEDIGNLESKSKVLFNLVCAYERMEEFQLAWETIEECQKVSVVIQDYSHQAMNLLKMGELLCSTGQLEDAIPHLIDSKLMYSRLGMPDRERADAYLNAIIDEIGIARYNEICSNLNPKVR